MTVDGSRNGTSSATHDLEASHLRTSLLFLPSSDDSSSPASLSTHNNLFSAASPTHKSPKDPLCNFRADASSPPPRPRSPDAPTWSKEDMEGIEDVTESQWQACPPGRSRTGESSSSARGTARDSEDDEMHWQLQGAASAKKGKGRGDQIGDIYTSKKRGLTRSVVSPSTSPPPSKSRKLLQLSSPDYTGYSNGAVTSKQSVLENRYRPNAGFRHLSENGHRKDGVSEDEAEHSTNDESEEEEHGAHNPYEEEEAVDSGRSSSPYQDTLITPHPEKADIDAVHWSPSPMSPRSMARRNRSSSSAVPKHRDRVSETPPFINDSPVQDGEAGPSSSPSVRSRSTSRKAAVQSRARSRKFIVLSDDEDEDYDPFVEGDKDAFTNDYKRQVEQEAREPEETDGSDGDDDMGGEDDERAEEEDGGEEEDDDFCVIASQQPKSTRPTTSESKQVAKPSFGNHHALAGPSRRPIQPQTLSKSASNKATLVVDDYADHLDDFFNDVDLDEISYSNPSNSPAAQRGPIPPLNTLFSSSSPKRPNTTSLSNTTSRLTTRTPLSDLPSSNIRPSVKRPAYPRTSLLQALENNNDKLLGNSAEPADEPDFDLGYMPVSKMPPKWRDFYMNHWRRGADRSTITTHTAADEEEEDEEPVPAVKTKAVRATKSTRGAGARRGGGRGGGRTVARREEDDDDNVEDDYEGDLGGPSAPKKTPWRSWMGRGRGRGGAKRGGAGARKRVYAKRK